MSVAKQFTVHKQQFKIYLSTLHQEDHKQTPVQKWTGGCCDL